MLSPPRLDEVNLDSDWTYRRPYPPLGFRPFSDCAIGNGDTFGLYWPIGLEDKEPIVAETWHDSWELQPTFSCLASFLAARDNAEDEYPEAPSLAADGNSPRALVDAAKEAIRTQSTEVVVLHLEKATAMLPEYTDALSLLWAQYAKQGRTEEAIATALRAIIAPPSFGKRATKALRWLKGQPDSPGQDDPIWQARAQLTLSYGGTKTNDDYAIYRHAIQAYIDKSQYTSASTLMQTYAELMYSETVSFQERYGFERDSFIAWQIEVSRKLPNGPRA